MLESFKDWAEQDIPPIVLLLILVFKDLLLKLFNKEESKNEGKSQASISTQRSNSKGG